MPSDFESAVAYIRGLPSKGPVQPTVQQKLRFYALYKQATVGDCNIPEPAFYQLEAKQKWKAWAEVKGKSKEAAEEEYVAELEKLDLKWRANYEASKKSQS